LSSRVAGGTESATALRSDSGASDPLAYRSREVVAAERVPRAGWPRRSRTVEGEVGRQRLTATHF
jgi:hypothetical protein